MSESQKFWEKQSTNYKTAFEELDELANYLDKTEKRHLLKIVKTKPSFKVLDLGCGTGRWAFEFAKSCEKVVAVDFAKGMIDRAKEEAKKLGFTNIEFGVAGVEDFASNEKFDIIIISGVLVYFEDEKLIPILKNVKKYLAPNGVLVSRETVGIGKRLDFRDKFNPKIGQTYSALYRTPEEYKETFLQVGLKNIYAEDFTPTNFPMTIYRKLVPSSLKQNFILRKFLQFGLFLQYLFDPILLNQKWLYRPVMNRFWKIKSMLFIYGIN